MSAEENLKKLNINLPEAPEPVGAYVASKIVLIDHHPRPPLSL